MEPSGGELWKKENPMGIMKKKTRNFPVTCLNLEKARTSDCSRIDVSRV